MLADKAVVDLLDAVRTFGGDDDVGSAHTSDGFAEATVGQEFVVINGTPVLGDEYGDCRLDVAVLKSVVEHYKVDQRIDSEQFLYAFDTVFAYSDDNLAFEFVVDLEGFVADVARCGSRARDDESFGLAFVSTAEDGDVVTVAHSLDNMLDVRSLASATCGEIPDNHDRHVKLVLFQDAPVKKLVAHISDCSVDFGAGHQYDF